MNQQEAYLMAGNYRQAAKLVWMYGSHYCADAAAWFRVVHIFDYLMAEAWKLANQ